MFLYELLWYCETKQVLRKTAKADTSSILDIFPYQNFSKTQKVSLTKVLGIVRQKFFGARNWYPPFLFINFFASGIFLEHSTEGFLYEIIHYFQTKQFRKKIVIPAPLLYFTCFDTRQLFETIKGFSTKRFGTVTQKVPKENLDTCPLLSINYFTSETLREIFRSRARTGSSTKCYVTVRQHNFDAKSWNPPPLLYLTCFDNKKKLILWRVPVRNTLVLWDKKISTKILIPAPSFPQTISPMKH